MVGLRLAGVRYVGMDYDDPSFERGDELDSLDYGVELVGDDGRVVGLTWDDTFRGYGIGICEGASIRGAGHAVWDVSASTRWSSFIGEELTAVDVQWAEEGWVELPRRFGRLALLVLRGPLVQSAAQPAGSPPRLGPLRRAQAWLGGVLVRLGAAVASRARTPSGTDVYPLAFTLRFGDRRICVAAIMVDEEGSVRMHGGDEIVVTADDRVAADLGLT